MGDPKGFLKIKRQVSGYRPVEERINDYSEVEISLPDGDRRAQAARCMDCGVPFCHAGFVVDGLSIGCPLSNLIPEINDLVYRGEIENAYARLSKTHPFPEFTSRVCPSLCEGSCTLGEHEDPVAIKEIERYIVDEMIRQGKITARKPVIRTGARVAVVGSGPSGLACADLLNQLGNTVTVFERANRPGGLLMYGIPNMKLDKRLVLNRIELMKEEGIYFITSTEIGKDYPSLDLIKNFDAVVLCGGATQERTLNVPGSERFGVMTALNYLTLSTKNILDGTLMDGLPEIKGADVIVVGGGDTGTDCVGTSIRRGAKSTLQFEIMPRPGVDRAPNNPWPLWPKVQKTDYGQKEAIELFGSDPRAYLTTVKEIRGDGHKATSAVTVEVKWEKQGGRLVPTEVPGTEQERPCGLLLTAMGFTGPERTLIDQMNLETDARGNVRAEEGDCRTSLPTVFAAGDMRRGPSLVVWAILEGINAAKACDKYLRLRQNV